MNRTLKLLGAALLATSLLSGSALAQTVYKLGVVSSPGNPEVDASMRFAELVSEKSDGEYRIDILHSGQAGGEREIAESLQFGTMDFAILGGILQNFDPALMIVEWDLLFKNDDHVKAVMNGEIGEQISQRIVDNVGARKIGLFMRSPRLLTTSRPVEDLDDLKGMKIRVPEMAARIAIWKSLGAEPTPMAFPEVVPALQLGTIDGQENPIGNIISSGMHEATDYIADSKHLYGFMFLLAAEAVWEKIPEEDQQIFLDAASEAATYNDELVAKSVEEGMAQVAKTMTITTPDIAPWREAASEVYQQYAETEGFTELYEAIVEVGESH